MSIDKQDKAVLREAADAGRKEDSMLAHVARGEIVLPLPLANDPEIKALLEQKFKAANLKMTQYTVGNKDNSINPETGLPEFGFNLGSIAGTVIGGGIGWVVGGPQGAITGAKIGAGVDATRAIINNAEAARNAAKEAQAAAIAEAQKNREIALKQMEQTRADNAAALEQAKNAAYGSVQQAQAAAAQQQQLVKTLAAQQQAAAEAARAALAQQQKQYEENKSLMEKQAKDQADALDAERRKLAERESAQMTARRRAGRRALLSDTRLNPELGITANPYGNDAVVAGA